MSYIYGLAGIKSIINILNATPPPADKAIPFLENNSVLIGIATSLIVTALELFVYNRIKFGNNRYLSACAGVYQKLNYYLKRLADANKECSSSSNIYLLAYSEETLLYNSVRPPFQNRESYLAKYSGLTDELYKVLSENGSIPCPRWCKCKKDVWNTSIQVIKEFTEFLRDQGIIACSNLRAFDPNYHSAKWISLEESIKYVIDHTNRYV